MQKLKINLKNNPDINFIVNFLKPYTKRAYLVGGSVRNLLLNLPLNDYDIELYDLTCHQFDEIMQKLGANGFGKSFFVYKYKNYDLALARYENKVSKGHRGFKVSICQVEKDGARRRDFTFNALMINIFNGEFLDFYGGYEDLKNKTIRHIDAKSFKEDSLRILRAIVFAARFNFIIAKESLELMREMDISDLNLERINTELYKFFKTENLALGYKYIQDLNLEEKIFFHNFNDNQFEKLLKNTREFIKDEALFLYLYLNYFKIDFNEFFKKSKLKKELLSKVKEEYFECEISDFELLKIALKKPLNSWLGLWDKERIKRAKKLKVYDKKIAINIDMNKIFKSNLNGKDLGELIQKEKEKELLKYLQKD
ncbi:CCA tRNA nucleotidyltransferase [Campylobacter novaezeelandiae]|uniref:CCA tRNA nucleotidyltransferase n=1 Tax=Campylobacter novaezeelandiae TaxID=2267891 RepID=UPI0019062DBA|nr:CCA tRNA nucleotidyltransferase [Campylobacter novaezeelandiae]MBK1964064.1 CCA tRNA nucleotidyltransferase [Campylobacter novaezeelandiae]MBK1993247.1 CCA tRNA nucleotidyltransferase [Campylobacter novaezeelandiae]